MPAAHKPAGGKTARGVKFGGKGRGRKKTAGAKGGAKKMPFGATKAPGARKTQPAMKKAMGGKMGSKMGGGMKKARKKK
jgi:hypothetical protein